MDTFENGLCRIGHSGVIHLVNPNPDQVTPFCKPNGTRGEVHPTSAVKPTCGRCQIKADAQKRRVDA